MRIFIETIPHSEQRYDTVGDWQWSGKWKHNLHIKVSSLGTDGDMRTQRYELLVALHELVEAISCHFKGINEEDVDRFDISRAWEITDCEPGDDPKAPYYHQHQFASGIERLVAAELDVDWLEYERLISEIGKLE